MCASCCPSASCLARASIERELSTAVIDPGRRASGSARRPIPQPYSRIVIGANSGTSAASITRSIHDTVVSPLAKNSRSRSGVRLAWRNRGAVSTAKCGSRAPNASPLFHRHLVNAQHELPPVRAAALGRHEELRALDRHPAVGGRKNVRGHGDRLLEVGGGIERGYFLVTCEDAHVRRRVEVAHR